MGKPLKIAICILLAAALAAGSGYAAIQIYKNHFDSSKNDKTAIQRDKYYTLSDEKEQAFFEGLTEWTNKNDIDDSEEASKNDEYLTVSGHVYGVEKKRDISIVYYRGSASLYWSDGKRFYKDMYGAISECCAIAKKTNGKYRILTVIEPRDGAYLGEDIEEIYPYKIRVIQESYTQGMSDLRPEGAEDNNFKKAKKHFGLKYGGVKVHEED